MKPTLGTTGQTTRKSVCTRPSPNSGKSTCIVILFFSVVWMTNKKSLSRNRMPAETHRIPRMSCSKMRIVMSRPSTILVSNGTEGFPVRKCFKPKVLDTAASPGFKRREFPDVLHSVVLVVHNHFRTGCSAKTDIAGLTDPRNNILPKQNVRSTELRELVRSSFKSREGESRTFALPENMKSEY